jgi:hypothetical protein
MPQQQTPAASLQPNDNSRLRSRVIPRGTEEEGAAGGGSGGGTGLMIGKEVFFSTTSTATPAEVSTLTTV